jgi:uncharacterized protein (TIGR02145 family)
MKKLNLLCGILIGLLIFTSCSSDENTSNDDDNNPNVSTLTDIDGNEYQTVEIGNQIWSKENLRVTTYSNGDPILQVTDPFEWQGLTTGAWCYYRNSESGGNTYGILYNWFAVNDARGIVPDGYKVPSENDWVLLRDYLITNGFNHDETVSGNKIGKSLASTNLWLNASQNGAVGNDQSQNNATEFTGLPGGSRWADPSVNFNARGRNGNWWSSTELSNSRSFCVRLVNTSDRLDMTNQSKKYGYSIRLIRE